MHPLRAGEFQQLGIIREQHRREAIPLDPKRDERGEKLQRVAAMRDEIQVHEDQFPRAVLSDVRDDFANRLLERLPSPRRRHHAEIAAMHAAAGRLEDIAREKVPRRQQFTARKRTPANVETGCLLVSLPHFTRREVAQQLRPGVFRVADHDSVRVRLCVLGNERHMRPAQHHGDASRAEVICEFVSTPRRAGDDGEPDQVCLQVERHVGDPFVD